MLALSPPSLSTFGWDVQDAINHEQNNNTYREKEILDSFLHFPLPQPHVFDQTTGDVMAVKKVNHNASERDRRKKINSLFSSLRSLLPASDQTKKLSITNTVSRVLKYIPELQKEVERLVQRKEELSSKMISKQGELIHLEMQREHRIPNSLYTTVSASLIGDDYREVIVQISTVKAKKSLLFEAIQILEEEGICLINASSFESFGGRVFCNLHLLQVQGPQRMEIEMLRKKLSSLCDQIPLTFSAS